MPLEIKAKLAAVKAHYLNLSNQKKMNSKTILMFSTHLMAGEKSKRKHTIM